MKYKKQNGKIDERVKEELQIWYNMDKGREIVIDLKGEVCGVKLTEPC